MKALISKQKGENKVKKAIVYFILCITSILFIMHPVEASSSDLLLNQLTFEAQINQDEIGRAHV